MECQFKGKALAEGHKSPVTDVRWYFHGNVVDQAMRQWLSLDHQEPGWMLSRVDSILDEEERKARETGDGIVKWRGPQDKKEVREFCRELVVRLENILLKYCIPYDWDPAVRFEAPLTLPYLDGSPRKILLRGEIDLLVHDRNQNISVYDLKATKDDQYWRKVTGQLLFYAIAVWGKTGAYPVQCGLLQPMCTQQVLTFAFTQNDYNQMFGVIHRTATDIWRGDLRPKADSKGCADCPVNHSCPKFRVPGGRGRVNW